VQPKPAGAEFLRLIVRRRFELTGHIAILHSDLSRNWSFTPQVDLDFLTR
jgi:hypothetical protein